MLDPLGKRWCLACGDMLRGPELLHSSPQGRVAPPDFGEQWDAKGDDFTRRVTGSESASRQTAYTDFSGGEPVWRGSPYQAVE